ncbi:IS3 family transposase [Lutimaribacter sp. EGI FJ00015]|uniref:IS3 family transposase n=1 Tax=Lutimaribacter degradans TaxID=2945989 RepID=A0ACC6A0Z9_9RHOB|nr:IS3 family transposase [Lutimaribacter sp. EGI FJ00013]MCM2563967.1 IS3 family transposase [Lutimaribacter sp. EGI FJ00013]MCO0615477.1 IS3 family transposase [Lutimaribacter sp. EGI FJ00015]MCO0637907.1 IS3 family transposase [Lutimaribacter sp. EGI FJ00014]
MGTGRTEEFRKDAVRIALTSGLTRRQVADDLGVGLSTLNKWVTAHRDTDVVSPEDRELARENERLRRENRILKEERDIPKKSHPVLREPKAMRFRFVEEQRGAFPIDRLCLVMNVSPRGLRAFRSRPASRRQRMDMVVLAHIKEQSRLSLGSYGRPRMTEELKEVGVDVGHRRVGRLMRENGITVERTRKFKATTDSDHTFNIAPNLLDRDFSAAGSNQKWAGDISYIWTREGWLYLAVILDLHSRRVIGWAVSNRMKRDLAIRALKMAIAFRSPPKGCIFHSDRGSQYCSHDYQKILRQHGFRVSMSGKGNCYDNAAVETFFKTIKAEMIWRRSWATRRQAEMAIFEYINGFYNPRRRHSALGWKSPVAFERKVA